MSLVTPAEQHGRVLQGTCGWTDASATFYPPTANRSTEDRLAYYCRKLFPCVEVDSSCYKIPKPEHVARWVKQVLPGFKFHFKAFGLFCQQSVPLTTLPYAAREQVQKAGTSTGTHMAVADLPPGVEQAVWDSFNASLEPVVKAGHMGCVVFQFHLNFKPCKEGREHVLRCRHRLRQDVPMAVEFRNRAWFQEPAAMEELASWCTTHKLALVAADELRHETYQRDRDQRGLPPGQTRQLLPISLAVTRPDFLYIRLHRRHGTTDRLLAAEEHQAWSARLAPLAPQLQGPVYFMWGTDWDDAPVANARALSAALPPSLFYDHQAAAAQQLAHMPGSITSFFAKANNASKGSASKGSTVAGPAAQAASAPAAPAAAAGRATGLVARLQEQQQLLENVQAAQMAGGELQQQACSQGTVLQAGRLSGHKRGAEEALLVDCKTRSHREHGAGNSAAAPQVQLGPQTSPEQQQGAQPPGVASQWSAHAIPAAADAETSHAAHQQVPPAQADHDVLASSATGAEPKAMGPMRPHSSNSKRGKGQLPIKAYFAPKR